MNKSKNYLIRIFFSLAVIVFNCNLFGQTNENSIEKQIDKLFAKYNSATSGVAVAVVKDGKVVFKKGYGMANLEFDVPITTKTVLNTGSVSKQFTAFAVYLLEKQGKLSLEDDAGKYIAEIPDYGKTVKIKYPTVKFVDYMSLLKIDGEWKIVNKSFYAEPKEQPKK